VPDAFSLAFSYLGKRERTESQVRARLQRAGCGGDEIDDAVAELQAVGQLDDGRFARLFAQDRRELDGWGQERIARRLAELGIDRDVVERTLAEQPAAELQRAVELLERRFGPGVASRNGDNRVRERAFGVLIRKGYGTEVAADAVRRWDGDRHDCID
jgi:regulatory protein